MPRTHWQMARRFLNVGSIDNLIGRSLLLEQKYNPFQYHQKTEVECISSVQKSIWEDSLETP